MEEQKKKLNSSEVLKIVKADLRSAKKLRGDWDDKIKEWRSEYYGEPYGNEQKYKSAVISRDIRRQSEWQLYTLVDPFVSSPDIIKISPVGADDRDKARQKEIIINAQFCRQSPRYNLVSKACKVLDMDGTCTIMTGWEYDESVKTSQEYSVLLQDGSELDIERYLSILEAAKQQRDIAAANAEIAMFRERQQLEQEFQQAQGQYQQLQMQIQEAQQTGQTDPNQLDQIMQQAQEMEGQLQEMQGQLQQPVVVPDDFQMPMPTALREKVLEEVVVKKNRPTAVICRNEDIFIDPTCKGDMEKAQFYIYRYETDLSTMRQDGRFHNLDKLESELETQDSDYSAPDETQFEFTDDARKKIVLYEYWGNLDVNGDGIAEPIVCAWKGDVVVKLQANPYPDEKPPFVTCSFLPVPFQVYGESNAALISDSQKLKTAILRGSIDQIAASTNGQLGIKKGMLDPANKAKFLKGEYYEYNGNKDDIFQGNFNQIPQSIFNMYEMLSNEIETQTGVKSFAVGGISGQGLGNTATSASGALDAAGGRRLHLVRNIAENLIKPLLRKWIAYDSAFLDERTAVRYTDEQVVWVSKNDLLGEYDLEINVSTQEDNSARSQKLAFLLQTIGNNTDPMIMKMIMAEIARLDRMPDFAKRIMEYEPQPDPIQEKIKELQVQLLEAQVANEIAKGKENEVDVVLKQAKAQKETANAEKISSERDLKDLDFLHKQQFSGGDLALKNKIADNNYKIERSKLLADLGSKAEQMLREEKRDKTADDQFTVNALMQQNKNESETQVKFLDNIAKLQKKSVG